MKIRKISLIISLIVSAACLFAACETLSGKENGGADNPTSTSVYNSVSHSTFYPTSSISGESAESAPTERSESAFTAESNESAASADFSEEVYSIPEGEASALPVAEESDEPAPKSPEKSPFFYDVSDGEVLITGLYADFSGKIVIPSVVDGLAVDGVAARAFANDTAIEEVVIDSGIKTLGKGCFENCKNLKKLVIPESVVKIGYGALNGCSALTELTLPFTGRESRTDNALNDYPFGYIFGEKTYNGGIAVTQYMHTESFDFVESADYVIPRSLKKVTVTGGDEATFLPYAAFYNCGSLDNLVIGGFFTKIGRFAFSGCTAKIDFLSPTIKCIGEDAIADYKGKSFSIPSSVEVIGIRALSGCSELENLTIPDGVKYVDLFAFSCCYELKSVSLGDGVEFLGTCAFYFCPSLKTVDLGNNLRVIDERAFSSCKSLTSVTLPSSLEKIGYYVFDGCSGLTSVIFSSAEDWYIYNHTTSGFFVESELLATPEKGKQTITKTYPDYIWRKRKNASCGAFFK